MRGGPYAAIALAVVSVSFASIFITWSSSPPITIALYRLAIATGIIGATILLRGSLLRKPNTLLGISRRDAVVMALIGAILATHFALWISSLKVEGESIASSVVLVTSHPLLVGLLSHYVLRERLNRWMTIGIVLGLAGVVSIALADYGFAGSLLYADILAFSGGVMAGFYFLLGRRVRQRVALLDYAFVVYASATAVLFLFAVALGSSLAPVGDLPRELLLFAALAIIPQIGGHTFYKWALRWGTAPLVSLSLVGETGGASLLAWGLLSPVPTGGGGIGPGLAPLGVFLTAHRQSSHAPEILTTRDVE